MAHQHRSRTERNPRDHQPCKAVDDIIHRQWRIIGPDPTEPISPLRKDGGNFAVVTGPERPGSGVYTNKTGGKWQGIVITVRLFGLRGPSDIEGNGDIKGCSILHPA